MMGAYGDSDESEGNRSSYQDEEGRDDYKFDHEAAFKYKSEERSSPVKN